MIKRALFWVCFLCSIICFNSVLSYSKAYAIREGQTAYFPVKSVRHASSGGVQTVTVNIEKFGNLTINTLTDPDRYVVDISGVYVPSKQQVLNVNHGNVSTVRYAQFDDSTARFVVDLTQKSDCIVKTGKGYIKIEVRSGAPDSAAVISVPDYSADANTAIPSSQRTDHSSAESASAGSQGAVSASETRRSETVEGTTSSEGSQQGVGNAGSTDSTGSADSTGRSRETATSANALSEVESTSASTTTTTPSTTAGAEGNVPVQNARSSFSLNGGRGVRIVYSSSSRNEVITISTNLSDEVLRDAVFTDFNTPPRLMVTLPQAAGIAGSRRRHVNTDTLKMMNISNDRWGRARIVFDFNAGIKYDTTIKNGVITITLRNNRSIKNLTYSNINNRPKLTLFKTYLTQGGEDIKKCYTMGYDETGTVCTIKFNSEQGDIGAGSFTVNDDIVSSVSVKNNSGQTIITITAKKKVYCSVFTTINTAGNLFQTDISLVERPAPGDRFVVIDAGHGGHDAGATGAGNRYEKDYNLDIAIRIDNNLKRSGIKTFLTRTDDSYVDNYGRALLANDIKADLFFCVHINAAENNPNANGTETLFNPNSSNSKLTSEMFAKIVQENVIDALNETDRGIKERPNLIVLRKTNMPAVLLEVAFISNKDDLANLDSPSFRRAVAKAVSDAIIEAFDALGK